jgi:thiamine-phosphate pyrophosphorylase
MATLTELARRLNARRRARARARRLPPVLLMTDERRLPDPLPAARGLARGSGVVLRHYGVDAAARASVAAGLARLPHIVLLVAGDLQLARAARARGLHLPEGRPPPPRQRPRGFLLTMAAHSLPALRRARALGADAAVLAPVFATASHPGARPIGPLRFAKLVRAAGLPVYALGGVTAANAARLMASGAIGFAAIGGLAGGAARR